jgi:hypothetical protein
MFGRSEQAPLGGGFFCFGLEQITFSVSAKSQQQKSRPREEAAKTPAKF